MKKRTLILLISLATLLISGCSSEVLLSEYFKMDLEQVIPIIETTYEKELSYSEKEEEILNNFLDKYKYGQYSIDGKNYEMNDLEKAIFNEVMSMSRWAEEAKELSTELASEKEEYDYYNRSKENLNELMEINNINKLPSEYEGKYLTYERTHRTYPEHFEEDMNEFIEMFNPIVNGDATDVEEEETKVLEMIFNKYNMEGMDVTGVPDEYELDGKYYLINSFMAEGIITVRSLIRDINEGYISEEAVEEFNVFKENLDYFGGS